MPLTDRGQTYTTSNKLATVNTQATLSYRGQFYQRSCSPCTVSPKANRVDQSVSYGYEEIYHNATQTAKMFGFSHHQIALSCPLEA